MKDQKAGPVKKPTRLESSGEVVVQHHTTPSKGPPDKQIHPRRPLPLVPERAAPTDENGKKDF